MSAAVLNSGLSCSHVRTTIPKQWFSEFTRTERRGLRCSAKGARSNRSLLADRGTSRQTHYGEWDRRCVPYMTLARIAEPRVLHNPRFEANSSQRFTGTGHDRMRQTSWKSRMQPTSRFMVACQGPSVACTTETGLASSTRAVLTPIEPGWHTLLMVMEPSSVLSLMAFQKRSFELASCRQLSVLQM
jgi:hypothetical protein